MNALPPAQSETIDPRILRRALGNFATGVTIITAHDGEHMVGVTANSFSSVSLDPPLVLWSIDKRAGSYAVFQRASHFAVNVLAMDQIDLSNRFARPHDNRFSGVAWRSGHGGCLLIEDTSASFQCQKYQTIEGGDHWILIGRVLAFEDNGRAPLLYHQGSYSMALPHPHREQPPTIKHLPDALPDRLADHPYYLMTQAVRAYQQAYQPEQLETGWHPGEARILMILAGGSCPDAAALAQAADMPQHEVEQSLDLLRSRGLVRREGRCDSLTEAGTEQVCDIWRLAQQHEEKVLARFDAAQIRTFKKVLKGIIAASSPE